MEDVEKHFDVDWSASGMNDHSSTASTTTMFLTIKLTNDSRDHGVAISPVQDFLKRTATVENYRHDRLPWERRVGSLSGATRSLADVPAS